MEDSGKKKCTIEYTFSGFVLKDVNTGKILQGVDLGVFSGGLIDWKKVNEQAATLGYEVV